jgi:virginiamycin A acetyltransferase
MPVDLPFQALAALWFAAYCVMRVALGPECAFARVARAASRVPGLTGIGLRRALYQRWLGVCGRRVIIGYGSVLSSRVRIAEEVSIGVYCHLDDAEVGRDCLLADAIVAGASGPVRIGEDCWIGTAATIASNVGPHCIVGAGSVVTTPLPAWSVAVGNPASPVSSRRPQSAI